MLLSPMRRVRYAAAATTVLVLPLGAAALPATAAPLVLSPASSGAVYPRSLSTAAMLAQAVSLLAAAAAPSAASGSELRSFTSAAAYTWTGGSASTSSWSDADNWGGTAPANDGTDDLTFTGTTQLAPVIDTSYSIDALTFDNSAGAFSITASGSNTLTIGAGGITDNSASAQSLSASSITLGAAAQTISVASGGSLTLGSAVTTSGDLTKAGAGALSLNASGSAISIGGTNAYFDGGTTTVQAGTTLTSPIYSYLAYNAGDNASLVVTGKSANWSNVLWGYVGYSGTGSLSIQSGASVAGFFGGSIWHLGENAGSSGAVTVDGYTTSGGFAQSTWNVSVSGGEIDVGESGSGSLSVTNGGLVKSVNGYVGVNAGSSGTVSIDGAVLNGSTVVQSAWTMTNPQDSFYLAESGSGSLSVTNGGLFSISGTSAALEIATGSDVTGTVTVSGGSTLNGTFTPSRVSITGANGIAVGNGGVATMNIQNGGRVTVSGVFNIDYSSSAPTAAGTESVSVDGGYAMGTTWNASTLSLTSSGKALTIGDGYGSASLSVTNGGSVTDAGTLIVGQGINLATLTVDGGTTLSGTFHASSMSVTGAVSLAPFAPATLTVSNGATFTGGALTMSAAGGPAATLIVNGGSATFSSLASVSTSNAAIQISNPTSGGYALTVGSANTSTSFTGVISDASGGSGGLDKKGTGTLTLNAADTFTGATAIDAGSIKLGNALALQDSAVSINVAGGLNLNSKPAVTLGGLAGTGSLALGSTALTLTTSGTSAYSGVMSGTGRLILNGTGKESLTGANTYSGGTTITAGTLVAKGGTSSGTSVTNGGLGTGAVTIASGATLAVAESLNTGSTDQSANIGTLTAKSLSVTASSGNTTPLLTFNLGASGASDSLTLVSGSAALTYSGTGTFGIGFSSATGSGTPGSGTYTLITFANPSASTIAGFDTSSASAANSEFAALPEGNLSSDPGGQFAWTYNGSGYVSGLTYVIGAASAPEPGSAGLMVAGVGIGVVWVRRRGKAIDTVDSGA